jgi:hypothetical protein
MVSPSTIFLEDKKEGFMETKPIRKHSHEE